MVKAFATLSTRQSTKVHSESYRCIRKSYEDKVENETYRSHKYHEIQIWAIQVFKQHQYVDIFQNAPKHRYSPLLNPTPNHQLGRMNKHTQCVTYANARTKRKEMIETRGSRIREQICDPHRQATHVSHKRKTVKQSASILCMSTRKLRKNMIIKMNRNKNDMLKDDQDNI